MNKSELEVEIMRLVWLYANERYLEETSMIVSNISIFYVIENLEDDYITGGF